MGTQEDYKVYHTPTLPRNLNNVEIAEVMSTLASPGWHLLEKLLIEKQDQMVRIAMRINTTEDVRAEARARYNGMQSLIDLRNQLDIAMQKGAIEDEK